MSEVLERRVCVLYVYVRLMCGWKAYFCVSVCDACVRVGGFLLFSRHVPVSVYERAFVSVFSLCGDVVLCAHFFFIYIV